MRSTLLMGNEAFAWAALEAGVNVVAGYPGTPSSELVETVAKLHAVGVAHDVYVEWSDNERPLSSFWWAHPPAARAACSPANRWA